MTISTEFKGDRRRQCQGRRHNDVMASLRCNGVTLTSWRHRLAHLRHRRALTCMTSSTRMASMTTCELNVTSSSSRSTDTSRCRHKHKTRKCCLFSQQFRNFRSFIAYIIIFINHGRTDDCCTVSRILTILARRGRHRATTTRSMQQSRHSCVDTFVASTLCGGCVSTLWRLETLCRYASFELVAWSVA